MSIQDKVIQPKNFRLYEMETRGAIFTFIDGVDTTIARFVRNTPESLLTYSDFNSLQGDQTNVLDLTDLKILPVSGFMVAGDLALYRDEPEGALEIPFVFAFRATDPILNDGSYLEVYQRGISVPVFTFGRQDERLTNFIIGTIYDVPGNKYIVRYRDAESTGSYTTIEPNITFIRDENSPLAAQIRGGLANTIVFPVQIIVPHPTQYPILYPIQYHGDPSLEYYHRGRGER